jgi:hypothetical protein
MNHAKLYRLIDFDGAFGNGHWGEPGKPLPGLLSPQILPPYLRPLLDAKTLQLECDRLRAVGGHTIAACFDDVPADWLDAEELERAKAWTVERARLLACGGHLTADGIGLS